MLIGHRPRVSTFANYLLTVLDKLQIPLDELAQGLQTPTLVLWRELNSPHAFRATTLEKIADFLDTTSEALLERKVPVQILLKRRNGDITLPLKYQMGAASKIRTLFPVLKYIETTFGPKTYKNLLRELNLTVAMLNDLEGLVSIRLFKDLLLQIKSRGIQGEDLYEMGYQVSVLPQYRPARSALSHCKTSRSLFEYAFEHVVPTYEKNFLYTISRVQKNSLYLKLTPQAQIQDAFKSQVIDSEEISIYRAGIMSAHPLFISLPPAEVRIQASMQHGSAYHAYEIRW